MPVLVEALVSDFGLDADQIVLTGTVEAVHHDTFMFHRIIENLVGNAIKYYDGDERLRIVISTEARNGRYHIAVKDNGPSIDPAYHEKIFDIFQTLRVGNAPESTGIGLAVVKRAVARNNGQVHVLSSAGQGATFKFDWPGRGKVRTSPQKEEAA